jgi:hypothetical protein
MAWPTPYSGARFNPWPIKYLMPAAKWFPIYWPPAEWEVVQFPPSFPRKGPQPPDGAIIPWWKMPKDQWPIEAPWEGKVFGAWPASQVTMAEDLKPSIWPGPQTTPPFGFIKIKMPGPPSVIISGDQTPKGNQIPFNHMRMHMRPDLGPIHHMKMLTQVNALGETKFYMIDKNWNKYQRRICLFESFRCHVHLHGTSALLRLRCTEVGRCWWLLAIGSRQHLIF